MSGKIRGAGKLRHLDLFIIIIFLAIAAISIELFRRDLLQTFSLQNVEPVGTVVIKRNIVQRRLADRVIWDRLIAESPVYIGDLIRIAEVSAATLYINNNIIDLIENTLIRIAFAEDGESIQVILSEGSLSFAAGEDSRSITIDVNGQQVQTGHGTVLSATVHEDTQLIQVIEGTVKIKNEHGTVREFSSGSFLAMNADGTELRQMAVVVTQPFPNMRYVKTSAAPLPVNFSWNRINLPPDAGLRLETASDSNFTRITQTVNNQDNSSRVTFDAGLWFWRISYQNEVLSSGQLTVADGSGMQLISPAFNSVFRYHGDLPVINFQWAQVEFAVSYITEVSNNADFSSVNIRSVSASPSQSFSVPDSGSWFWRVKPVFPAVFRGDASFSATGFFRILAIEAEERAQEISLANWLAAEAPSKELPSDLPPEIIPAGFIETVPPPPEPPLPVPVPVPAPRPSPPPPPPQINLTFPANGAQIAGLTALRQQTSFTWNTTARITSSRFVISRNANPLQGTPARVISNPARTVNIAGLSEGTWYWTVEIRTANGITASAPPRRLQVLPIPSLPAPRNLQPASGNRIDHQELISQRAIVFRWAAVQGANAYIFTLSQQTQTGRRQIIRTTINSGTSYTLNNMRLLDRGTFVWQIEPVNTRGGEIEQRGAYGENTFIIDIPLPGPIQIEDMGILYGN